MVQSDNCLCKFKNCSILDAHLALFLIFQEVFFKSIHRFEFTNAKIKQLILLFVETFCHTEYTKAFSLSVTIKKTLIR